MTHPLDFEALQGILHQCTAHLPDHRTEGLNTRYAMQDAALGAFCVEVFSSRQIAPRRVSATWRSSLSWARSGRIVAPSVIFASCLWRPFATCSFV
jgi:hypothetical protein